MSITVPVRRLAASAALAATAASLAGAATASAAHVTAPGPWKATNAYQAQADLDGRTRPALNPVARVDHVRAGEWIRITCQARGEAAYGSRVWIKTGGLFVPDKYVKTYTDGFLAGVPRCGSSTEPTPHAPAPGPAPAPTPAGPTRAQLSAAVAAVTYERVYGSGYRIFKERFPPGSGIDWNTNGCSVPKAILEAGRIPTLGTIAIAKLAGYYSNLFQKSCDRHDFGYRNYGGNASSGLHLDVSWSRKISIDNRLLTNARYQCQQNFKAYNPQRAACYWAASQFHKAVLLGGGPSFF